MFMVPTVTFLGHWIDAKGLNPLADKVKAIEAAPIPTNITELKSYPGLLTYYGKFLPNLADKLTPLYKLLQHDVPMYLQHDVPWKWTEEQDTVSKKLLTSSALYDQQLPLTLACDASGLGRSSHTECQMGLSGMQPKGITHNSKRRDYRFYAYLFGRRPFELVTDHQPLLGLLGETRSTSPQASARIRRWSLYPLC